MTAVVAPAAQHAAGSIADTALSAAARLWFAVALIGQWAFVYYIANPYGPSTLTGHFQAWSRNTNLVKGYVAGDTAGNVFFGAHALMAAVIAFGGAIQLIPLHPDPRHRRSSLERAAVHDDCPGGGVLRALSDLGARQQPDIPGRARHQPQRRPDHRLRRPGPGARRSPTTSAPIAAGRCGPI